MRRAPPHAQAPRVPEPPRRLVPAPPPGPRVRPHGVVLPLCLCRGGGGGGVEGGAARGVRQPRPVAGRVDVQRQGGVRQPPDVGVDHPADLRRQAVEEGGLELAVGLLDWHCWFRRC